MREGVFSLPVSSVKIGGKAYITPPLGVRVKPGAGNNEEVVCWTICVVSGILSVRILNNLYLPVMVNAVMCGLIGYICLDGDFRWTLTVALIAWLTSFVAAWLTLTVCTEIMASENEGKVPLNVVLCPRFPAGWTILLGR